jgi:hypothetical protein
VRLYHWRSAVALGALFIVIGVVYLVVQGRGNELDLTGATLLIAVGAAMAFTFTILFRGSGEL